MIYLSDSLKAEKIREDMEGNGVRITLVGLLHHARIPLQIDVGFGDVITPSPEGIVYPTLFGGPNPLLKAYPRYTLVAEKIEAMVRLGHANSRMKDFYDIWLLSGMFSFDGEVLRKALKNTFDQRRTAIPKSTPAAFSTAFSGDSRKQMQWKAFIQKSVPDIQVGTLSTVVAAVSSFLSPVLDSLNSGEPFANDWLPDRGWINSS